MENQPFVDDFRGKQAGFSTSMRCFHMFSRGYTHDYPLQSLVKNHQWSTAHRSDGSPLPEMAGKSSKKGGCLRGKSSIKMGNFPLHVWLPEGTWDSHQIIACLTCFLLEKIRIRHWIDMMEKTTTNMKLPDCWSCGIQFDPEARTFLLSLRLDFSLIRLSCFSAFSA